MDIAIAIGQSVVQIVIAWMGIRLSMKEGSKGHAITFGVCALFGLGLTVTAVIRGVAAQTQLTQQLQTIQKNTEQPPRVSVTMPPTSPPVINMPAAPAPIFNVPPPTVIMRGGASGPLPSYALCEASGTTFWTFENWATPRSCREVTLPWDEMPGVKATVEIRSLSLQRGSWVQVRIWDVGKKSVAVEAPRSTVADFDAGGQSLRILLPRDDAPATYKVEMMTQPDGGGDVGAIIVLSR